jgi:serine/threonine protein kinase
MKMQGHGAPTVYYTGHVGRYFVCVMQLLGPTLQKALESRASRRFTWPQVSQIALKCLALIKRIHDLGYVHGDVKPENFLLEYREPKPLSSNRRNCGTACADPLTNLEANADVGDLAVNGVNVATRTNDSKHPNGSQSSLSGNQALPKIDINVPLYVIDMGLATRWREDDATGKHVPYGQRIDHFSGTVRYASVNAHLGRYLSRRDDLESLAYMLIYLLKGQLPWQGFVGDDKNMQVCECKGRMLISDICRAVPDELRYFLAYARQLKFAEQPDYEYMARILDCKQGIVWIHQQLRLISEGVPIVTAYQVRSATTAATETNGATNSTSVINLSGDVSQNSAVGADVLPVEGSASGGVTGKRRNSSTTQSCVRVVKRARAQDSVADPDSVLRALSRVSAAELEGSPRGGAQAEDALALAIQDVGMRSGRFEIIAPRTTKTHQWIIVSTSANSASASAPASQVYTSHTSYKNLVREVERKWAQGMRISLLCFDGAMWTSVLNAKDPVLVEQAMHYCPGSEVPRDWIRSKWDEGFYITACSANHTSWGIVASTMNRSKRFKQQSYIVSSTFPAKWCADKWTNGYAITCLCIQGPPSAEQWLVVMSRGTAYKEQVVELDFGYPSESIHQRWDEGYMLTAVACGADISAYVMSRGHAFGEEQRCTRTSHGPLHKIREDWSDGLFITATGFGRIT